MSTADNGQTRHDAAVVLKPYSGPPDTRANRRRGRWLILGISLFCLFYGALFSFFVPYLLIGFTVPIMVLVVLVIWALPDMRRVPTGSLNVLFFTFFATLLIWPNYLAIAPKGLPWITLVRLVGLPLALLLMICVSISKSFRSELWATLNATPRVWKLLATFVVIQILSIVVSSSPGQSIDKLIVAQTNWTAIFLVSAYLFVQPRRPVRWAMLLWGLAVCLCLIGLVEYRQSRVPWANHIPSFLQIDDPSVQLVLAGQARSSTGVYRVQSTFSTPLALAEFLALTFPFVVNFIVGSYRTAVKLLAAVTIPLFVFVVFTTDSRLGLVGFAITALMYPPVLAAIRWKRGQQSLVSTTILLTYPFLFSAAVASTFLIGRIRNKIWGNGAEQASNTGRLTQYETGIPMVLKDPIGHGVGMGAQTLGFMAPSGLLTIDTFYLLIALEYGIIGFLVYYSVFGVSIWNAFKYSMGAPEGHRDFGLLVPLCISLTNYFIIKSVFAQQDNQPLIFMMLGMVVALVYRLRTETVVNGTLGART